RTGERELPKDAASQLIIGRHRTLGRQEYKGTVAVSTPALASSSTPASTPALTSSSIPAPAPASTSAPVLTDLETAKTASGAGGKLKTFATIVAASASLFGAYKLGENNNKSEALSNNVQVT